MRRSHVIFFMFLMFLLILSPVVFSHSVSDTYAYRVYLKIDARFESENLSASSVPSRLVLVFDGITEFKIIELSRDRVTLKLRPNLTISGEVEPSSLQQNLQELLAMLNAEMNKEYEVYVPSSIFAYVPYGNLEDFIQQYLGVGISQFSMSLNITKAEPTIWKGIPALLIESTGNITSSQDWFTSIYLEGKSYVDLTTFLTLYSEGRVVYNFSYSGMVMNCVIEAKTELTDVNVVKDISSRAYEVKLEEGESRIYIASENLNISSLSTNGGELTMRISGSGLGGIIIFTTEDVRIQKILVDNTPAKYQVIKYAKGNLIRVPLTLSEHEIKITYEKTIKSAEEIPVISTGINSLLIVLTMIVVPTVVLIALLMYLLRKK